MNLDASSVRAPGKPVSWLDGKVHAMRSQTAQGMRAPRRRLAAFAAAAVVVGGVGAAGVLAANSASAADASTAVADLGWATQSGGTSGGSAAAAAQIYTVSTKAQLMAAIAGTDP